MRAWRLKVFKDPLYRTDRTIKNANKVVAAKRRKRDITGKFNFEEHEQEESKGEAKSRAASLVDSIDLDRRNLSVNPLELAGVVLGPELDDQPN